MNENSARGQETAQKVALVTGANKGIGREVAGQFAALGMTVLLGSRDPRRGEDAAAALRASGGEVHPITLDVTDQATIRAAAKLVTDRFGSLDVLVNNAGISGDPTRQAPGATDLDVVRQVFGTNFLGAAMVADAMLPLLRRAPAARIVNLSSSVGSLGRMTDPGHYFARMPGFVAYPTSKAALNMLTVQYAKALRAEGILVNAADPGHCATDFTKDVPYTTTRTAADGAAIAVRLATLGPDGPTGGFFDDAGEVPW
jgi:NAD(P)-dependent dehydrogenase (short-subunit alcohol dehydrogenase family)